MRTEYNLMKRSVDTDSSGRNLPDIMTLNLADVDFTVGSTRYQLTKRDVYRFDRVILNVYGSVSYYMNIVLILNDIPFLDESYIGKYIYLPLKNDLDDFYLKKIKEV